jgi:hypothetical protein
MKRCIRSNALVSDLPDSAYNLPGYAKKHVFPITLAIKVIDAECPAYPYERKTCPFQEKRSSVVDINCYGWKYVSRIFCELTYD